ncbi:hypothetical protein [Qipengyuania sp. MTN3-11]|uniref:hypothetical protein n=1 Tax=Qipengyuania sp. MTN3-11 TaxID=3056557 RepID=UPI0036F1B38A
MKTTIEKLAKGGIATAAVGAMALASATPAAAQYRDRDRDGIGVGEIIAGAVILGGIAAVAGSIGNDRNRDNRYYRDGRYGYYNGNPRQAVEACVNAANNDARRSGYRYAQVTEIRNVNDTRNGWRVRGNIRVDGSQGYGRYDRYDRYDRRGYNRGDNGRFTCEIERGRIRDIDYDGIRGLR